MTMITAGKQSFPINDVLFTFALDSEAANIFDDYRTLMTGYR